MSLMKKFRSASSSHFPTFDAGKKEPESLGHRLLPCIFISSTLPKLLLFSILEWPWRFFPFFAPKLAFFQSQLSKGVERGSATAADSRAIKGRHSHTTHTHTHGKNWEFRGRISTHTHTHRRPTFLLLLLRRRLLLAAQCVPFSSFFASSCSARFGGGGGERGRADSNLKPP